MFSNVSRHALVLVLFLGLWVLVTAAPFDTTELTDADIGSFSDIAFAAPYDNSSAPQTGCRTFPGDDNWPTEATWNRLNETIDGSLLKPIPPAAVCYAGPYYNATKCGTLIRTGSATHFYLDDPLSVLTEWPQGSTCVASLNAQGNCTQGGFPTYVVNVTTPKQAQAAVNFARNRNLRLVVKNTGHDFGGRSTGAGALSVWIHNLKSFEFLPEYTMGQYTGMAIRYGPGIESWEMFNHMGDHNLTIVAPGGSTVGMGGGWLSGGGHSTITSITGLGADQVLSLQVVTADGMLQTASPEENEDLFYALRGGGGATFGIILSVIAKAHPQLKIVSTSLTLDYFGTPALRRRTTANDTETFWKGVSLYYRFARKIVDAGGLGFSYIYPLEDNSFQFTASSTLPNKTPQEFVDFMQPLYDDLLNVGINATNTRPAAAQPFGSGGRTGSGASPNNLRYTSRLFPRTQWDSDDLWDKSMSAVRKAVEAGYTFHGTLHSPNLEVAGWPGNNSAVNPAWRVAALHAMLFYKEQRLAITPQQAADAQIDINKYMDTWRALTPGSGAYINEADPAEPHWQDSFFGSNYPRLLSIKQNRDPWNLLWAPNTVGSEPWAVAAVDGYPFSENGKLCRTGS